MDAMPRAIYYTQRIQIRPRVILGDQGANYVPGGSRETIFILAGNSNFLDFFTKPNRMGVYGLPTSATKTWHFWAYLGPLEGPGVPF